MSVTSIRTKYDGTTYRSRAEARWALLFDLSDIAFQYEPEGYRLKSAWYVPDFWLESWASYFEVKPEGCEIGPGHYTPERFKAEDLASHTRRTVFAACGWPTLYMDIFQFNPDEIAPDVVRITDGFDVCMIRQAKQFRFDW